MAATFSEVVQALKVGLTGLPLRGVEGETWQPIPGSLSGEETGWEHGRFRVMPAGGGSVGMPGTAEAHVQVHSNFGMGDEETLGATLGVRFYRLLAGDPDVEEPAFLDELIALGAWMERRVGYPDGMEYAAVEGFRLERDMRDRTWGSGIVYLSVRWNHGYTHTYPEE